MAASASTEDQWRWRRDDGDLDDDDEPRVGEEEGEVVVPGSHSDTDTDEYYNRHSPSEYDDEADSSRRAATSVVVVPANIGSNAGSRSSDAPVLVWGGTGKRGRTGLGTVLGGMSVSPSAETEHVHQSMAAVAAAAPNPVLQPVPLAFAPPSGLPASSVPMAFVARTNLSGQSSSAQWVHDDAVDTVVAGAGAASRPSPPAEAATHHQPLAPPPPRPAPAAGRQNPNGYTCPKCGMWFATHQGLGGHSIGHKHRERELLLAVPGGRDDDAKRRERVHVCGDCGAEFATGVQLGGHKRKHWAGAPIVPKKKPRAVVVQPPLPRAAELVLPLPLPLPIRTDEAAPPAVEPAVQTTPQPATRPLVPGRVRLFGVDIVPAVQTPQAQQGSIAGVCDKELGVQIGCLG